MADLTREEQFLSGIAEGSTVELKPITRREQYLAKIAGQDVVLLASVKLRSLTQVVLRSRAALGLAEKITTSLKLRVEQGSCLMDAYLLLILQLSV